MFGNAMEAKAILYNAIDEITKILDLPVANHQGAVEQADLDRLSQDRDRYIWVLHSQLNVPVLELAREVDLPWPRIYAAIDSTFAEHEKACKDCGGES
jgi:hypothetical protein